MSLTKLELDRIRMIGKVPYKVTKEKNCEHVVRERWQDLVYFFQYVMVW